MSKRYGLFGFLEKRLHHFPHVRIACRDRVQPPGAVKHAETCLKRSASALRACPCAPQRPCRGSIGPGRPVHALRTGPACPARGPASAPRGGSRASRRYCVLGSRAAARACKEGYRWCSGSAAPPTHPHGSEMLPAALADCPAFRESRRTRVHGQYRMAHAGCVG